MSRIRKIAAGIATLWLVAVVAIGVGGTWLTHNPEALAEGTLAVAGIDVDELQAQERAERARRDQKIEARQYNGSDWGDAAVPGQDGGSDWGD